MKFRVSLVVCILAVSYSSAAAQTQKDIDASYGHRENVYSVGEHLWMTPAYGTDGQLCSMRVYPKQVSIDTNYLDDKLEMDEVLRFINKLVPLETRGARADNFGLSDLGGGVIWTKFNYDRVRFVFISTFDVEKLAQTLLNRKYEALDLEIDEAAVAESSRKRAMQSDDELIRAHTPGAKVVEIYWAQRCSKDSSQL